ncbi:SH3 domain-binding protein 4 [Denticeps clupeoides]|uniref:SH3 domain-binding protein 4 n=1 Tax=Denticeps clupeoides TaxID=299321 RepID=A0AAY4ATD3_9TELE|nr:SH3 domain-binding protein 4-like [Denticeps clupeoides]
MAAHRIKSNNIAVPRCKSEGMLIEQTKGVSEVRLSEVKVLSPSTLRLDTTPSFGAAREVVAIKDYCPSSFTTLKFSKGDRLFVIDTSHGEWWYAHNNIEMGYIPSAYVQPLNCRDSPFSDSGMVDSLEESTEEAPSDQNAIGEWSGLIETPAEPQNGNIVKRRSINPFLNIDHQDAMDQNANRKSIHICDNILNTAIPTTVNMRKNHREPFKSKRCYSLSELSILKAQADNPPDSLGVFGNLKSPVPEEFQSREDFRTAWLNHRKLARSCHDLDSLGQNPGWGQTQPVETHIVCRLDSSGGAVELPDTGISIHVPEGHVAPNDTQQISMKALLDPPLELNNDQCTTVCPVVELRLSNMETKTTITLEMKVSVVVKMDSRQIAEVVCVRSDSKEGPYTPVPQAYMYGDTIQVRLDNLEPCMYVSVVAHAPFLMQYSTVWEHVLKKVTIGVYGPKHIHPSFKTVVAIFGHDCAPKTLLVSETAKQPQLSPSVSLQLWGRHQFVLAKPQDLQVGMYSNMSNYEVKAIENCQFVRGFQVKLGKVCRLVYTIAARVAVDLSDFTLRIQVKDKQDCILAQFCVQTPPPPPKSVPKSTGHRRFLKKNEMSKIILSPLAVITKYPVFQDCLVTNIKFGRFIKTVNRKTLNPYRLEYKKGDMIALLSDEKIKLKGHLWTKEWYIGYYRGRTGLIHTKNVLVTGKVKPLSFKGPDLTSTILLQNIVKPCMFLTYMYASVRTTLMENVGNWRAFADALGYVNLPLSHFCRTELEGETEKVAAVLEKLKEDCNNPDVKERNSFQKELMTALLKMDCQGLVARLVQDFALLTTAVEIAGRWRELAEKLSKVSRQQMDAFEAPHRDVDGLVEHEAMWKPAYDFLLTWASQIGDSYRDVIHELHVGLDKMKSPITKRWKHLTGTLILVNCLDLLRTSAFNTAPKDDCPI